MKTKLLSISLLFLSSCTDGFSSNTNRSGVPPVKSNSSALLVATTNDRSTKVYSSSDMGDSWTLMTQVGSEFDASPLKMLKTLGADLIIGSHYGAALMSLPTGGWRYYRQRQNGYGKDIGPTYDFAVDGDFYVAATGDGVNISDNGGQDWRNLTQQEIGAPLSPTVAQVQIHNRHIYISTLYDIMESFDLGKTWRVLPFVSTTKSEQQGNPHLSIQDDFFFVTSLTEGIFRSGDAGLTWERLAFPDVLPHREFASGAEVIGARVIAWNYMGLFLSQDRGTSWTWTTTESITGLTNRMISEVVAANDGILVLTYVPMTSDFQLYLSRNQGRTWKQVTSFDHLPNEHVTKIGTGQLKD